MNFVFEESLLDYLFSNVLKKSEFLNFLIMTTFQEFLHINSKTMKKANLYSFDAKSFKFYATFEKICKKGLEKVFVVRPFKKKNMFFDFPVKKNQDFETINDKVEVESNCELKSDVKNKVMMNVQVLQEDFIDEEIVKSIKFNEELF